MERIKIFNGAKLKISIEKERATLFVCIGIALLFWFFVKLSQPYETSREVNVQYVLPEGKAFVNIPPSVVVTTLNGTGWDLFYDYLANSSPSIDFRVEEYPSKMIEPTQLENRLKKEIANTIKVTDTDEEYILLEYQDEYEKLLPVRFDGKISFSSGYDFKDSIKLEPDSVMVSGPVSLVQKLESWSTSFYESNDCRNTINVELPLMKPKQGQIIMNPATVNLNVEVEEYTQKTVYVPIVVKNATDSIRLSINNVKVDFVVGLSRFNEITKDDFIFEADFNGISLNDVNNVIPLSPSQIPNRLKALNFIPKSVEFFIVQKALKPVDLDSLNTE